MKISAVFETFRACGLTSSQIDFSTVWLGRSARYYSHLIATHREPGLGTLCGISWRLGRMSLQRYPAMLDLKQQLEQEIARRAITDRKRARRSI